MLNYQLPFEHQNIYYDTIKETDRTEVVHILAHYFGPFEPMNHSMGITAKDFAKFAELMTDYVIDHKLSLIAKDKKTQKVVSVTILKDFLDEMPINVEEVCPKLLPVFALMGNLAGHYLEANPEIQKGNVMELLVGITIPTYWNRGISTILWGASEKIAQEHGFKKIVSCVTGLASQHITLQKLHYKEFFSIPYKTFFYGETAIFEEITEILACKLVEKNIHNAF
ncbi:MAG: GNAT family N-acetyltransferase [Raineya sp.]|jgi:hypothetical protein|nr:GNAT family N-acetyltransferase [Raineya sp.]